jgi:hypothetical protein
MNGERRLIGCPGGTEAAGLLGHGGGRLQGLLDPAFARTLIFPGRVALDPDLLLGPDLGRLGPIVSDRGGICAVTLTSLGWIRQRRDRKARSGRPGTVQVTSATVALTHATD